MIRKALRHLPGVGPERLRRFEERGLNTWEDLLGRPNDIPLPSGQRQLLLQHVKEAANALSRGDLTYLTKALAPQDQWRILQHAFDKAAYFDIETTGLGPDSLITVIACLHQNQLHTFVQGENLDDFLDLLDEIELLVSFNGASFDVPQVERGFHIAGIPCAHVDLRWVCYHEKMTGGLKSIEHRLGIQRPQDLHGVDGEEAVWLWEDWIRAHDREARERLLRYCAADVLSLQLLAARILSEKQCNVCCPAPDDLWSLLHAQDQGFATPTHVSEAEPSPLTSQRRLHRKLQTLRGTDPA